MSAGNPAMASPRSLSMAYSVVLFHGYLDGTTSLSPLFYNQLVNPSSYLHICEPVGVWNAFPFISSADQLLLILQDLSSIMLFQMLIHPITAP